MEYSQELADAICQLVAEGKSIRTICSAENMPAMSTIFKWLRDHALFSEQYARAKAEVLENYADELVEISDDTSQDTHGELEMPNSVAVQRAKLRVDTRKWLLSKLAAKKYGDSASLKVGGDPDGVPLQAAITVNFVKTGPDGNS